MSNPTQDWGILNGTETLHVKGRDSEARPCSESFQTTTGAIAALSGGGGLSFSDIINAGSSVVASVGGFYGFNSASGVPKTIFAPPAIGSLGIIEAADLFGDAYVNNITFNPSGTDVVVGNQDAIYTDNGSARWRDVAAGIWVNV